MASASSMAVGDQIPKHLFFGCWGASGHYMFTKSKRDIGDVDLRSWEFPMTTDLDGSRLLLPNPEREGYGCRTYLPALHVTVLSWWNRVFDTRPGVNSHFLCRGRAGSELMWDIFNHQFQELAKHHTKPIIEERY